MSVIIDGIDIEKKFGVYVTDESTFAPPTVKSYLIDRPGGDSKIDATEVFGDVLYDDREDTLVLLVEDWVSDFSNVKTDIARFLHGKEYDFTYSWDPGYTYHGRFFLDEFYQQAGLRKIKVKITANPYKSAGIKVHEVDAQAGAHVMLNPGRGRVQPVFESKMPIHVIANGVDAMLPAGSHTAVGLSISSDAAEVYVNTGGSVRGGSTTWGDLKEMGLTWGDLKGKRWHEVMWLKELPPENDAYKVKIAYEVKEL